MSYLPGPKMEQEVRRQLAYLGIDMKKGIGELVKNGEEDRSVMALSPEPAGPRSISSSLVYRFISVDTLFTLARWTKAVSQWSQGALAKAVLVVPRAVPAGWRDWDTEKENDTLRSRQLDSASEAVDSILDVHGHQIFSLGLFNAGEGRHAMSLYSRIHCPPQLAFNPQICKTLIPEVSYTFLRLQVYIVWLMLTLQLHDFMQISSFVPLKTGTSQR